MAPPTRTSDFVQPFFRSRLFIALALTVIAMPAMAGARPMITVAQAFLADTLDPIRGNAGWSLQSHGVAEGLFRLDEGGEIVPHLAESVTAEGPTWRLRLRPDRTFSDGSPVDAETVRAALLRANTGNPIAAAQTGRLEIDMLDALTLRLRPERPVPVMASVLAEWAQMIHKPVGGQIVFTGPYRIVEHRPGDRIVLHPNPHFPGAPTRPNVTVRRIIDPQARALALEIGEADLAYELAADNLPRLRRNPNLTIKSTLVAYQYMMFFQASRPPLDDVRVRRAVDLALDRGMLVEAAGGGEVATGIYPSIMPFALPAPRPTDRAQAERLLDEAGWRLARDGVRRKDDRGLELVLLSSPQRPDFLTLAPVVKSQLGALGFRIATRAVEAITTAILEGNYHLAFLATHAAPGGDGAFILERLMRSTAVHNFSRLSMPRIDAVLDRLRETTDGNARTALLKKAQAIMFEEAPAAFLMTPLVHTGLSERLADYRPYPSDYFIVRPEMGLRR
ncbi:MAG: ABC transporter substrate-binding protein [Pseudomonadota bacterium]